MNTPKLKYVDTPMWGGDTELERDDSQEEKELKKIRKELKELNKNTRKAPLPLWGFRTKENEALFWWLVGWCYFTGYIIPQLIEGTFSILTAGQVGFGYIIIPYIGMCSFRSIKRFYDAL